MSGSSLDERVHYSEQPDWLDHSTDPLWDAPGRARSRPGPARTGLPARVRAGGVGRRGSGPGRHRPRRPGHHARQRILQRFVRWPSESGSVRRLLGQRWERRSQPRAAVRRGVDEGPVDDDAAGVVHRLPAGGSGPAAAGGYLGAENQMIRVMVTSVDRIRRADHRLGFRRRVLPVPGTGRELRSGCRRHHADAGQRARGQLPLPACKARPWSCCATRPSSPPPTTSPLRPASSPRSPLATPRPA